MERSWRTARGSCQLCRQAVPTGLTEPPRDVTWFRCACVNGVYGITGPAAAHLENMTHDERHIARQRLQEWTHLQHARGLDDPLITCAVVSHQDLRPYHPSA